MRLNHCLAGTVLSLAAAFATAQTLTIEGGGAASTTGLVPQSFAPYAAKAGYNLQVVLNQVLTKSIMKVGAGKLDLSVAPPPAYLLMERGAGPYALQADTAKALAKNVRALFAFQGSTMHPVVWADSGITQWSDLKDKRIFVGPPAGAANSQSTGMVESASNLKADADYEPVKLPWGQATQSFQDGQYDLYIAFFPIGSQTITEMSLQRKIRILSIAPEVFDTPAFKAYEKRAGVSTVAIPANTYSSIENADQTIHAVATAMMVIANASMPDETAYALTKAYWEALPQMKASNALLASQDDSKPLAGVTAKLHPGAIRYYQERGMTIPPKLL